MGYYGFIEKRIKAQSLRGKGLSYKEIQKFVDVPKSTLSGWCKDIFLTEKQLNRLLENKLKGAARGRIIGAKKLQAKKRKQIKQLLNEGKKQIGKLTKRDRFITGVALYAAEGTKIDKEAAFANSDPIMIKFMMSWFREFCLVPEHKFRGAIWLHDNLSDSKAKKFWSKITGIPLNQFHKTYLAKNKTSSLKIRKNKHQNGVFSIKFSDKKILRLIMGWIAGVLGKKLI